MRYAKKDCQPADLLKAAVHLHNAAQSISNAVDALNGKAKSSLLTQYLAEMRDLRLMSMALEDDFAELCVQKGLAPNVREVPLFGSDRYLGRAEAWLRGVQG